MANPAADMAGAEFLLSALMFVSASSGSALTILGGGCGNLSSFRPVGPTARRPVYSSRRLMSWVVLS